MNYWRVESMAIEIGGANDGDTPIEQMAEAA